MILISRSGPSPTSVIAYSCLRKLFSNQPNCFSLVKLSLETFQLHLRSVSKFRDQRSFPCRPASIPDLILTELINQPRQTLSISIRACFRTFLWLLTVSLNILKLNHRKRYFYTLQYTKISNKGNTVFHSADYSVSMNSMPKLLRLWNYLRL